MTIILDYINSVKDLDPAEYRAFFLQSKAPLFYDQRFLIAAEQSPLLNVSKIFYLLARDEGMLTALVPIYLQKFRSVDSLGLLVSSAKLSLESEDRGLFSHIIHCTDTTIPMLNHAPSLYARIFDAITAIAQAEQARYFCFLNVQDGVLLREAQRSGLNINFMVDKFSIELDAFPDFNSFVQASPKYGRYEMTRKHRIFNRCDARARILAPPFDNEIYKLSQLYYLTTKRLGTPYYWPESQLADFCHLCGDLVRLGVVEHNGEIVSGFICFEEEGALHVWSAGMDYDSSDFNPYTLGMSAVYHYAFERGINLIECGRLNPRIKTRLGFKQKRLYSVISQDLGLPAAKQTSLSRLKLASQLDGEVRLASHPAFDEWYLNSVWNGRSPTRRPAGIVRATTEADVIRTIVFAKERGMEVSVRGSGHNYTGCFLRIDTLMLDISGLKRLDIDCKRKRAIVESGVSSGQLCHALAAKGLAFPTGHVKEVGISGFLLGGGLGINCSQWGGMSVFNVQALDIVTADGRLRHVSETLEPDLFWAARGAGPCSFFVVTRFYLSCYSLPRVITNSLYTLPFTHLHDLLARLEDTSPPTNLQVMISVSPPTSGGTPAVLLNILAFTDSPLEAQALHESFETSLELPLTALAINQPSNFEAIYEQFNNIVVSKRLYADNILTDNKLELVAILSRYLSDAPSRSTLATILWRGVTTYPKAAFSAHGKFFVSTYAQWDDAKDDSVNRYWLKRMYDELQEIARSRYINEYDLETRAAEISMCFAAENWEKLQRLRLEYDPDGVFVDVQQLEEHGDQPEANN
ncbi:GNAT family N-acetyltransferase [Serratia fonticola]|uniref:GNAT family N-acetyltransferase n=1 Tax=Serratia fonticola TaxID=47917 RepID=A0AAW3WX44_SERFO|nr:GNAT family N-acetyltransferase [Serratia fonticola]MBC3215900.1 GNAT family N-acetyltransferase [Serratia fonticola]NYA16242.1 GNAT family N-acetyltransferase [Serratia fonticola]NYA36537.1 GNAT family N-acetyltransferase [Serratia fonticola]